MTQETNTSDISENNLISEIDIVEHKIEVNSEEDNVKVELPTQELSNDEKCCQESSSSSQNVETNTVNIPTQFVDCGPEIKEEIKEENVESHDPLRLSYAVQSLDEPV